MMVPALALFTCLVLVGQAGAEPSTTNRCDRNGYGLDEICAICAKDLLHLMAGGTRYSTAITFGAPELVEVDGAPFEPVMRSDEIRIVFSQGAMEAKAAHFLFHAECSARPVDATIRNLRVWFRQDPNLNAHPLAADQTRFCSLGDKLCETLQPTYVNSLFAELPEQ